MAAASISAVSLSFSPLLLRPAPRPPAAAFVPARRAAAVSSKASSASPAPEKKASGLTKPRPISPALQAVVGSPEISRAQALKLVWAYIKQHNLQDPEDKKIIVCDEKLKAVFAGRERVGFLEIAKLLNPHFVK